MSESFKDLF